MENRGGFLKNQKIMTSESLFGHEHVWSSMKPVGAGLRLKKRSAGRRWRKKGQI